MQLVKMKRKGKLYDLGHILPMIVNGKHQFIIIPNYPFEPPFICLRLVHAHRRMAMFANRYLDEGGKIDFFEIRKIEDIEPEYCIEGY
jgi:hypothetical protein